LLAWASKNTDKTLVDAGIELLVFPDIGDMLDKALNVFSTAQSLKGMNLRRLIQLLLPKIKTLVVDDLTFPISTDLRHRFETLIAPILELSEKEQEKTARGLVGTMVYTNKWLAELCTEEQIRKSLEDARNEHLRGALGWVLYFTGTSQVDVAYAFR
jgi:hypothetical protein